MEPVCKILLTTFPSESNPITICQTLIKEKLAACIQVIPQMTSIYPWEGKINTDSEVLVLMKTSADVLQRLADRLKELHPYKTPEIMALQPTDVDQKYLMWLTGLLTY